MKCCSNCFGDRGLKQEIRFRSDETGRCSYCASKDQSLVKPTELSEFFGILTNTYRPSNKGKTLAKWLKEDWALFDAMDIAHTTELLEAILNDSEIVRKTFLPTEINETDSLEQWKRFREELMYENRFFPKNFPEEKKERLKSWLENLIIGSEEMPSIWYRARIQKENRDYELSEMGAPERRRAKHGRANPAGIPYLYLGSTPTTVVSEVRPHPGQVLSVAENTLPNDLKIIDLRNPRKLVSPFQLGDEEDIVRLRADIPFLEQLGKELKTPVLPTAAAIDYLPSQYLCELIKNSGYDGVIYDSSVSDGINLALFYPERATGISVSKYMVSNVSVESNPIES